MADGHSNTPNPPAASLLSLSETLVARPRRSVHDLDLEEFLTPLVHATRALSCLDPTKLTGTGASEAFQWLADYAHDRAHELQSFINGHQPLYMTAYDAAERDEKLSELPEYSDWQKQAPHRVASPAVIAPD